MKPILFSMESLPPFARYERLFAHLPDLPHTPRRSRRGRPRLSPDALLRAHVYRALRALPRLSDLVFDLQNNPSLTRALGFDALRRPPSLERFSAFLHDTSNETLQAVRKSLTRRLLDSQAINPRVLAIDSCPIPAPVKQNNMKTGLRTNRFDKTRPPRGDPEARLGVRVHYPHPDTKKVSYFWGYRNHVLSDADSELPLAEITHPANVSEISQAVFLLSQPRQTYSIEIEAVVADAAYDAETILSFIMECLHAQACIPANPRNKQSEHYRIEGETVLCQADLPMRHKGRMTPKNITYIQYVCPLHYNKKLRQRHLFCPV